MIVIASDKLVITYHTICGSYVDLFFSTLKEEGKNGDWMTVLFFCCKRCEVIALCMEFKEELTTRRFSKEWFNNPTKRLLPMKG